jgi:hypothetical protein
LDVRRGIGIPPRRLRPAKSESSDLLLSDLTVLDELARWVSANRPEKTHASDDRA